VPAHPTVRSRLAGLAALVAVSGGCAERRLVAAPAERPGTGTWVAVWVAGGLAATVAAVLLTLPLWRDGRGRRPNPAAAILALQAGAAAVVGAVLVGFAVRSWQLIERPLDRPPAAALVRISRIDGDTALFALFVLTIVVLGGLLVALLALGARLAASDDRLDRWVAVGLLSVELVAAGALAGLHLAGFGGWPFRSGLVALPVAAFALGAAWPRR
jgi:hypothetical protein